MYNHILKVLSHLHDPDICVIQNNYIFDIEHIVLVQYILSS